MVHSKKTFWIKIMLSLPVEKASNKQFQREGELLNK